MNRTVVLAMVVLVATSMLAGCTSQNEDPSPSAPTETHREDVGGAATATNTETTGPQTTAGPTDERIQHFQSELEDRGVLVERIEHSDDRIDVWYRTIKRTRSHHLGTMNDFIDEYASLVRDGETADRLEVRMLNGRGDPIGRFHIMGGWVESYNNGGMTERELQNRTVETLEPSNEAFFQ